MTWDDFASEYARLQVRREQAFSAYRDAVLSGRYPAPDFCVAAPDHEVAAFAEWLDSRPAAG